MKNQTPEERNPRICLPLTPYIPVLRLHQKRPCKFRPLPSIFSMQLQICLYTRQEHISSDSQAMIHRADKADKMPMTTLLHPDLPNGCELAQVAGIYETRRASHF